MLSLGSLLTHHCHSHLVAHDHICKAMLITIVTRALFLAGSVPPWLCGRAGTSPPWSKAGCGGFSRARLCFCALPLCATSPTLPTTCWLLSWLFCVTSSAQCPQRTRWGPKFCIKDVLYIQGQSWDFWGSNCLFSSIWGLFGVCTQLT